MGWIDELYKLIDDESPAMEASDDITGEVSGEASKVLGSNNDLNDNNGEIDLNTNDILGTKGYNNSNGGSDAPAENPDEGDSFGSNNGDREDLNDQNPGDLPEEPAGDPQTPEDVMNDKEAPFSASRKKKLWKNFKTFYESLGDSVKLISQYVPKTSDANTIRALDNIRDNLIEAKEMVYDILTKEYPTMEYPELQKRYIGLNHIYDLCTKELETYFDKYHDKT